MITKISKKKIIKTNRTRIIKITRIKKTNKIKIIKTTKINKTKIIKITRIIKTKITIIKTIIITKIRTIRITKIIRTIITSKDNLKEVLHNLKIGIINRIKRVAVAIQKEDNKGNSLLNKSIVFLMQ